MTLDPTMLKQIKNDTLRTLRLQNNALDARDWATINNYLKTTKTLREIDISSVWGVMDMITDALIQNGSVTRLVLGYDLQEHNVPKLIDILKANSGITSLNLGNCYNMSEAGGRQFTRFLQENRTITHLDMPGLNNTPLIEELFRNAILALEESPNIVHFSPNTEGRLGDTCVANRAASARLLKAATDDWENLSAADIQDIKTRLPSILHKTENDEKLGTLHVAKIMINLEDIAASHGISFAIPPRYQHIADGLPRPFRPSADKVDFSTAGALTPAIAYQAAEAGQIDSLLGLLKSGAWKISAEACLFKPDGKRENMIELIARQGRLADIMAPAHWTGKARDFKQTAGAVPVREWRRQLKDHPPEKLLAQINAASFKKARRPTGPQ